MARYNHLPIYNTAFGLLKELYIRVPKLNKQYKYTLGSSLIFANMECIKYIVTANNRPISERKEILTELIWKAEEIIILLRVVEELKLFSSDKQYLILMENVTNLARQAEGWRIACGK
jgi:hypothetical protein